MSDASTPTTLLVVFLVCSFCALLIAVIVIYKCAGADSTRGYVRVGNIIVDNTNLPTEFLNDEEALVGLSEEYDFKRLSPEEQSSFLRGEQFTRDNPPEFHNTRGRSISREDEIIIKERGVNAFEFEQDADSLQPRYIVEDKTEINFLDNNSPYSTATSVLNYSLPVKNRSFSDCIYFETKVFEYSNAGNPNAHFSIGLVTKPYPAGFRLPGYNNFSIAYESTGNLKINKPFPTPLQQHWGEQSFYNALVLPPLLQSDIVGFGYHVLTGTVFITRNGKKLMDVMKGLFVDMYPAIGCFSTNAKFQVNLGQLGFVWIEANVKKYGFISTSDYKRIRGDRGLASLPQYGTSSSLRGDQLLDKGDELPPKYPEDELDFFGRSRNLIASSSKHGNINDFDEKDDAECKSKITHEPEEIMDLRERLYEQNITFESDSSQQSDAERSPLLETSPLLAKSPNYGSSKENSKSSEDISSSRVLNSSWEGTPTGIASSQEIANPQLEGSSHSHTQNRSNNVKNKKKKKSKKSHRK
ncbi:Rsp5p-dependent ubiquitination, sorting of cargo proteins at the multivesicular body [Yamadazyma tenuis]|uniref:B30.2/SPRY domain-containing protein n=1 Tax=Candida tenuis (strain ATCC 10573 / BCRC 21748 / CBS 615 / JCM 9827 / NBRC 10315 / NRRL Y-1498 / VKM Y-70) TaxID=590646 RepID=G3B9N5_CANTC|nr:uncharacterized protein CANTEDRAFT_135859 [Yamadazyma tenuis ATCC 10573]EGV61934.1 hypothetical protein CANTEDRAFT_135859 [Yamadazyma tenuis ATCC 10573]WEJ93169.1 Rsp5p-dependent ubiquitination, sorting of cargo proteins at the multivesicular body [Yamadazyma tenuis]